MATLTVAGGGQVTATDDHRFWVADSGAWVGAGQVQPGDQLLTPDGVTTVAAVAVSPPAETLVWELDIATDDTFAVGAGSADVLVHNAGPCDQGTLGAQTADVRLKGFSKGKLAEHFEKHGAEFGNITQSQYLKLAKQFATKVGPEIRESKIGNIVVKYDESTKQVIISNIKDREIRTFYIADTRSADPFQAAIDLAGTLTE
jgi:hypothetical protein